MAAEALPRQRQDQRPFAAWPTMRTRFDPAAVSVRFGLSPDRQLVAPAQQSGSTTTQLR
jgi:hypothetical protein